LARRACHRLAIRAVHPLPDRQHTARSGAAQNGNAGAAILARRRRFSTPLPRMRPALLARRPRPPHARPPRRMERAVGRKSEAYSASFGPANEDVAEYAARFPPYPFRTAAPARHSRSIAATWSRVRMRAYIFIALSRL